MMDNVSDSLCNSIIIYLINMSENFINAYSFKG